MYFKKKIVDLLVKETAVQSENLIKLIEIPPDPKLGDYAFPCFILSKELKKSPNKIATELKDKLHADFLFSINAIGPYLNFKIKDDLYANKILNYEFTFKKTNNKIMVEFSQPNTHKEFHVGHLRNACLGDSIVRLLKFVGNEVVAVNYIGDIGTHVAKALWCLDKFHKNDVLPEDKGKYLGKIYVEASKRLDENESYKEEISKVLQSLEARSEDITKKWIQTRKWSLEEFKRIYSELDIHFDKYYFESEEDEPGKKIALELLKKNIAEKSEGAIIVNLEAYNLGIALILKTDGTSLYLTKDLSLGQKKFKEYDLDESIYLIDSRQSLHMQQVFKILELMGFDKPMRHISYEFVSTPNGPIASRKGNVILYLDLQKRIVKKIIEETKKRHPNWTNILLKDVAQKITLGALKFGMLKMENNKEIIFDELEWLDFEGETGPYIQYTYCRLNSILKKASSNKDSPNYSRLSEKEDKILLRLINKEKDILIYATKNYKPSILARYILELAQKTNEYYHKYPVLTSEKDLKNIRLILFEKIKKIINRNLLLLGIQSPEEM